MNSGHFQHISCINIYKCLWIFYSQTMSEFDVELELKLARHGLQHNKNKKQNTKVNNLNLNEK